MGAPWLPHKIPWSVMFFPKHNGHLPGGLTTPFADTAICRYSHYPQLIYPYKIPYYIPVRSPITIISHHSDTYPIHSHSNFQLWAGKPSRPAFLPGGALPCLHTTPKAQDVLHGPNARQDLAPRMPGPRDPRHTVGWDTNAPRWPIGNQWHEV